MVNVGKYTSPMHPLGFLVLRSLDPCAGKLKVDRAICCWDGVLTTTSFVWIQKFQCEKKGYTFIHKLWLNIRL